jgi:hypothetical protein
VRAEAHRVEPLGRRNVISGADEAGINLDVEKAGRAAEPRGGRRGELE